MHEITTESGERVLLLEDRDLEPRLETFIEHALGKAIRRFGIALIGLIVGSAAAWFSLKNEVAGLQREMFRMDKYGTSQMPLLQRQLDSLRFEIRAMPSRVADEVEMRMRSHR